MIVIALGVLWWQARESRREQGQKVISRPAVIPTERYELLARFEPPPPSATKDLSLAMDRYRQGDYRGAIRLLKTVDSPEAHYYLGICYLLSNDSAGGIRELRRVAAGTDPPLAESARFYLAKALLGSGDVEAARRELEAIVAAHGNLEKQAQSLLAQIR